MSDNISPPTVNLLCRELEKIFEWEKLAVYLNLRDHVIQNAKVSYPHGGIWDLKMHCLKKWLEQTNTVHSRHTIADAVEGINARVADSIRTKYATILYQVNQTDSNILLERNIAEEIIELEHRFAALVAETQDCLEQRPKKLLPFYRYLRIRLLKGRKSFSDEKHVTHTYSL